VVLHASATRTQTFQVEVHVMKAQMSDEACRLFHAVQWLAAAVHKHAVEAFQQSARGCKGYAQDRYEMQLHFS
jgi:hypothetical protein